ncbi:MAG: S9 family peptidase [Sedimentisphaerales bacterium]|nr:S9 family peptidase [Sedimentisphaerales bacterium]
MAEVELIGRKDLFGNPDRMNVQVSPDGAFISYLADVDGVLNIWVGGRDDIGGAEAVTHDKGRGIRDYSWAHTSRHILYLQDEGGDENDHVYAVDLETNAVTDLTPFEGVQGRIYGVSAEYPEEIVVAVNNRVGQWHDLYKVNIVTGERELLLENNEFADVVVDDKYRVRLGMTFKEDSGQEFYRYEEGQWRFDSDVPAEDGMVTGVLDLDKKGEVAYLRDSRGRNTAGLVAWNLATGEQKLLAEDAKVDAEGIMVHPQERTVQAVSFVYDRKRWEVLDEAIAGDLAYLQELGDGELEVVSRDWADRYWVAMLVVDDGPSRYYLYDRERGEAEFLFSNRSVLEGKELAKMRPVVIKARDGLELLAYYTLPVGSDSDGDGVPDEPLPTVFCPHGGPWHRDYWTCHPWHQWLANRGYAVLCVNFRSSTGFGKAFVNAGDLEWGGKIHDDQIDAVRWAIEEGIADEKRVAVFGGSFGGYSTLAGLTFTPEVFACGVDLVGISNLETFIDSVPDYWKPFMSVLVNRVGDPATAEGRKLLKERSPLTYVDRICKPLLIAQGANDPRVKQAESDQIVEAMQAKGIAVTYLLYGDEGHGFARPENNLSFYAVVEAFLAECLGGRVEAIGNDFEGSSIEVRAGAEHVAGLVEAMG